jgi:hypothetical protein
MICELTGFEWKCCPYLSSAINHLPLQALVRPNLRFADDKGDELEFSVFAMFARLVNRAIGVVGEVLVIHRQHVGFRDQM